MVPAGSSIQPGLYFMNEPKILIAILACHKRTNYCDYQRITWIKDIKYADHRFFFGVGAHEFQKADEVRLDVPDDYPNLALKVRGISEWAVKHDYDFVFKCDDDTFVNPVRLLNSGFEKHDYVGEARVLDGLGKFICSGGGYWLSRKALQALAESPTEEHFKPRHMALNGPEKWQEDRWVAEVLQKRGIRPANDRRCTSKEFADDETVIAKWEYPAEKMLEEYQRIKQHGGRNNHTSSSNK